MNKNIFLLLLIGAAIIFSSPMQVLTAQYDTDTYWNTILFERWFYALAAANVYILFKLIKSHHWSIALLTGYCLMTALYAFAWPTSYQFIKADVQGITAYTFACILIGIVALGDFGLRDLHRVKKAMCWITSINSFAIIFQSLIGVAAFHRGGIFGNPSMSGCFIGITLPFLANSFFIFPAIAAIILTGSSQPIVVGAVSLSAYLFKRQYGLKIRYRSVYAVVLVVASVAIIPFITSKTGRSAFDSSGRFAVWKDVLGDWLPKGKIIIGQGTGSTAAIVPRMQPVIESEKHANKNELFHISEYRWFHSDYIQMFFENGIIGLILLLISIYYGLIISYKKSAVLFSSLCGYLSTMLFNFPAHFASHAFVGGLLVSMIFKKEQKHDACM